MPTNAESTQADRAHVFHSWSAQGAISPMPVAGGKGALFWDNEGHEYIDFSSQLVNLNLGHQHPRMIEAIREQAGELCTIAPGFANDVRSEAARLIAERAPEGLERVFFTNGGAEAVENALRMAKLHTGRHKVLSAYRSYHGSTAAAIAATGEPRRWASEPTVTGSVHFFGPYLYRSAFGASTPAEEAERALEHLEAVITLEGPGTIAGLILETVVGTNGVLVPPPGYLQGVRELCDRFGIVMISDEVMVGFGRLGEWFGVDHWNVTPDLITFAKGVNSGYVPLGGVLISDAIAADFEQSAYPGGLTYSGHPLACAAAVESISIFAEDDLCGRSRRLGDELIGPGLAEIGAAHPSVGEVRGMGCFFALELVRDPGTREPLVPFNASGADAAPMNEVLAAVRERGVWPFAQYNRIHIAPPLVIGEDELQRGLEGLDAALSVADSFVNS
ncbi:MAG: aspartate aminotransferase family protein [Microthrixaceae bacterium]|nr:aspartate aminotransferase family protein [Microthrixaceae bacterium]MCB1010181.1 aspartate aminotransferase family protein [Microthrixaceae bacterium]MCO5321735.1 aspartate aminotransferase family protein [Microthrixaceae bacterium]